ncbi:MAG: thiol-disulfide oxidoreductase DCC family protein [Croceimicrobium sp.]
MVWDGDCSFCRYWIDYWKKMSGSSIQFEPYQEVAKDFPDIEEQNFKEAVRFIATDGLVYSGPDAAYRSLYHLEKFKWLHRSYANNAIFRNISDHLYQWIANNRNFCFRITKFLFGSDPESLKPFWFIYLFVLLYILLI